MSEFAPFSQAVKARYEQLSLHELFVVDTTGDLMWMEYLSAFPAGTNEIYRERTEHDCSTCRNFIKNLANVVAVVDDQMKTVWEIEGLEYPYDVVAAHLDAKVKSLPINGLFRTKERQYGMEKNFELIDGTSKTWNHFHGAIRNEHFNLSPGQAIGSYASAVQVFQRGLVELSADALTTVLDLIAGNALYRGDEFQAAITSFAAMQRTYQGLTTDKARNLFVWEFAGNSASRFRNTAIGTLIQDLSEGVELEAAVKSFESKVAPTNYKRTSALITPAMIKQAMVTIGDLGLESALERRFATIHDISVNNVLWVDGSVRGQMKDGIEGLLLEAAVPAAVTNKQPPEDISIDDFMAKVVPQAKTMNLFVASTMQNNFMSLTAPVHADANSLFKWANNFGWSYNGNITDSIKEKVKRAGGNTEAKLRVSLGWFNSDDLDIHCHGPEGHIYFGQKYGVLDVDMNAWGPKSSTDPVENLSWTRPGNGEYRIQVNQYNRRMTERPGFVIEVENNGQIMQFNYPKGVSGYVDAITFTVKDGIITDLTVCPGLSGGGVSQEKWGIKTEQYVKVNTLMFSPNHWDDQHIGNKHWFFMLDGCLNDEPTRGIYNEFLKSELDVHRKVFEVLGNKTKCLPTAEQLSGLGFSSTRGDTVLVQVQGDKLRKTYNISF